VHRRILMVAALSAGVFVVACSRPTSQNDQNLGSSATGSRQIDLVDAPGSAAPLVSDLEARRAPKASRTTAAARVTNQAAGKAAPDASPTHEHAMGAVAVALPRLGTTTSVVADPALELARAPRVAQPTIIVATEFAAGGVGSGPSAGNEPDLFPGPISRTPTIIIRGGMGGPHDDCKIHGPGGAPGLAINRIAPGFGGEVRGNTGGRFPRGGIR